jgi:hypothetical protein
MMDGEGGISPIGAPSGIPIGIVLNGGQFKLEKWLRHDGHAHVYSISATDSQDTCLEARVYPLEGVSRKVRQYRLRNIKRLSSRTVLESRRQEMVIVVYKAGEGNGSVKDSRNDLLEELSPHDGKPAPVVVTKKIQQKTDHQREADRIRQLERRRSNRRKERELKAVESLQDETIQGGNAAIRETEDEEPICTLFHMHHAQSDQPQLHEQPKEKYQTVLGTSLLRQARLEINKSLFNTLGKSNSRF